MASIASARPTSGHAAIGLFVAALALRPQVIGIGPLAIPIAADLGVSHAVVGLLSTLPILAMGLFASLGPVIARRLGTRTAMSAALIAIGAGGLIRVVIVDAPLFVLVTIGIGVGMGIAGALPQILAKAYALGSPGRVGGAASAGIVAGAVLSSAAVIPLASLLGGWRPALGVLSALTLCTSVAGMVILGKGPEETVATFVRRPVWRLGSAWLLALVFGLQAVLYWGAGAWLSDAYLERGWTAGSAATLVSLLNISSLAASITTAVASDRFGPRRSQIVVAAALACVATLGFAVVPDGAVIWTVMLGLGLGAIFPLLLVHTVDLGRDAAAAGSLSAFTLTVGYVVAALGPLGLGITRDLTGGFASSFGILAIVGVLLLAAAFGLHLEGLGARPLLGDRKEA